MLFNEIMFIVRIASVHKYAVWTAYIDLVDEEDREYNVTTVLWLTARWLQWHFKLLINSFYINILL